MQIVSALRIFNDVTILGEVVEVVHAVEAEDQRTALSIAEIAITVAVSELHSSSGIIII